MRQPEMSKSDNRIMTAYSAFGNAIFCIALVVIGVVIIPKQLQNAFIWSLLTFLLLGNLCLSFWLRKRNRVLFRNQLFITGLSVPFTFVANKLYNFLAQ
jgi:hypothetical protein